MHNWEPSYYDTYDPRKSRYATYESRPQYDTYGRTLKLHKHKSYDQAFDQSYDEQPSHYKSRHLHSYQPHLKEDITYTNTLDGERRTAHPCGDNYHDHKADCSCFNWNSHGGYNGRAKRSSPLGCILCYVYILLVCTALIAGVVFLYFKLVVYCYDCTGGPGSECATMRDPQLIDYKSCLGKVCVSMCNKESKAVTRTCMAFGTVSQNNSLDASSFCATDKCNGAANPC